MDCNHKWLQQFISLWGRYDIVIAAFRDYGGDSILSLQLLQLFVIIGAIVYCRTYGGDIVLLLHLLHLFAIVGAILSCYCNCYNCSQLWRGDITTRAVPLQHHRSNRLIIYDRKGRPLGRCPYGGGITLSQLCGIHALLQAFTIAKKAGDRPWGRPHDRTAGPRRRAEAARIVPSCRAGPG